MRIHAESPHVVLKFFRAVDDFTFVKFISKVGKNDGREFYPHAQVYPVGFRGDIQVFADLFLFYGL